MPLFTLTLLAVGIVVGGWQLTRGEGSRAFALPLLRLLPLPPIGLALQLVAVRLPGSPERLVLMVASQVLLLAFCLVNLRYPALRLLLLGFLFNLLPMMLSGGYMPITPEALSAMTGRPILANMDPGFAARGSKDILLPMSVSPLWFLGDVFVIPYPFTFATAFSIGDVLIALGFGFAVRQFTSVQGERHGPYRLGAPGQRRAARLQVS